MPGVTHRFIEVVRPVHLDAGGPERSNGACIIIRLSNGQWYRGQCLEGSFHDICSEVIRLRDMFRKAEMCSYSHHALDWRDITSDGFKVIVIEYLCWSFVLFTFKMSGFGVLCFHIINTPLHF
jgi:hypothetical protein